MFPKPVKGAKKSKTDKTEKVPSAKKPPRHIEEMNFILKN